MATYAQAQSDYRLYQSQYRALLNQLENLDARVSNGASTLDVTGEYTRLSNSIATLRGQLSQFIDPRGGTISTIRDASGQQIAELQSLGQQLYNEVAALQDRLPGIYQQMALNSMMPRIQRDSAGEIVGNDSEARAQNANSQSPPVVAKQDPATSPTSTNAQTPQTTQITRGFTLANSGGAVSTIGADEDTKTVQQTQRTRTAAGASAANDDQVDSTRTTTGTSKGEANRPVIAKEFLAPIVAKDNILSSLSSYTYTISIYLCNAEEMQRLIVSQKKILPSKQLLVQSAGAPVGERNQWFNVDFYIEDLQIESVVGTQGTGSVTNATTMEFKIIEPNGITFLNRLNNAVIQHMGNTSGNTNAFAQNYLMVIRFYGYDQDGNQVTGSQLGNRETLSDQNSVVEKFIPFMITNFKYQIASKATEYSITAVNPGTSVALSTQRASIPFNMRLVASDVQTLLNGNLQIVEELNSTVATEEEAGQTQITNPSTSSLKGATITQGLAEALNEHQRRLVAAGSYEIADEYEIVLENILGLKDAKLAKPGRPDKKQAGGNTPQTAANLFLSNKTQYDKETKTYNVTAGTQIVQLIDLVMRTSTYVTSQQNVIFDEKTGEISGKTSDVQVVQWYRVRTQVVPKGYDSKRKTIAYKIKYTVSRYAINTPRSPYYPPAAYRGVHKLYNYWFTGQNTEVLDFTIDVNQNYFVTIGNDGFVDQTPQGRFAVQNAYQSAPGGSMQGGTRGSSVPAANLSDRLYSMYDVATTEVSIVGDPDWLQQSEVFYNSIVDLNPFMPDGSVNYDASEVLFEIRFNPVVDYDLRTGLTPVYENNIVTDSVTGEVNIPQENIVFAATTVTSSFKEGAFTQNLNGYYRDFAASVNPPADASDSTSIQNQQAAVDAFKRGAIDYTDQELEDQQNADGLEYWGPILPSVNTPRSTTVPNKTVRLQSTGTTTNFNVRSAIDAGLPYRDTQIDGQTVRVYGSERDLLQYIGPQAVEPKPNSGENAVDSDAGDSITFGGVGGYGKGIA